MSVLLFSLFSLASAWWCNGHMTTAMIAQLDLQHRNPRIYDIADGILSPLNGALTHNIANTFTETACWPDDIKTYHFNEFDNAHFIDKPYNPLGISNATGLDVNVVWAIENLKTTLKGQTVLTAPLETSMALRFLIHFLGDIHQPLHDTTLWNKVFPNGDMGGNLFPIQFNSQINELHALWDSCMGVLENDLQRPLNQSSWAQINTWASWAMGNYTRADLAAELTVTNMTLISIESYKKAIQYAYNGIEYGGTPSQEYLKTGWQVVLKQLALGGYRLADLLISLLSSKNLAETY